jgi:predicted Kef-type K+ transport protein
VFAGAGTQERLSSGLSVGKTGAVVATYDTRFDLSASVEWPALISSELARREAPRSLAQRDAFGARLFFHDDGA